MDSNFALHEVDVVRLPGLRSRRHRQRGPRSADALMRRSSGQVAMHANAYCRNLLPPSGGPSQSGPLPLVEQPMVQNSAVDSVLSILHVNIRGWLSHHAELEAHIRLLPKKPMIVAVNESFLNASVSSVKLNGYELICRHDRDDGKQGGGILVFIAIAYSSNVTLLKRSDTAERCWCLLHSDRGPLLLCC